MTACGESESDHKKQSSTSYEYVDLKTKTDKVQIFTVDGCEYLVACNSTGSSISIVHKANCKNHTPCEK
jgi:hypothetical protein